MLDHYRVNDNLTPAMNEEPFPIVAAIVPEIRISNPIENKRWTQAEAIQVCIEAESIAPEFGCHVALTGGALYKFGSRKDLDILFYRIRQNPSIDTEGLFEALERIGIKKVSGFGWCYKCTKDGKPIDAFFPEEKHDGESNSNLKIISTIPIQTKQ